MRRQMAGWGLGLLVWVAGCAHSPPPPPPSPVELPPPSQAPAQVSEVSEEVPPTPPPLPMDPAELVPAPAVEGVPTSEQPSAEDLQRATPQTQAGQVDAKIAAAPAGALTLENHTSTSATVRISGRPDTPVEAGKTIDFNGITDGMVGVDVRLGDLKPQINLKSSPSSATYLEVENTWQQTVQLDLDGAFAATVITTQVFKTDLPPGKYKLTIRHSTTEDTLWEEVVDIKARTLHHITVRPPAASATEKLTLKNTATVPLRYWVNSRGPLTVEPGASAQVDDLRPGPSNWLDTLLPGSVAGTVRTESGTGVIRITNATGHPLKISVNDESLGVLAPGKTLDVPNMEPGQHRLVAQDVDSDAFSRVTMPIRKAGEMAVWTVLY